MPTAIGMRHAGIVRAASGNDTERSATGKTLRTETQQQGRKHGDGEAVEHSQHNGADTHPRASVICDRPGNADAMSKKRYPQSH